MICVSGDDAKWRCYVCDPKPLLNLIETCTSVMEAIAKHEKRTQEIDNRRRRLEASRGNRSAMELTAAKSQAVSVIQSSSTSIVAGGKGAVNKSTIQQPATQQPTTSSRDAQYAETFAVMPYGQGFRLMKSVKSPPEPTRDDRSAVRSAVVNSNAQQKVGVPSRQSSSAGGSGSNPPSMSSMINEQNVATVLDRLLSATHSMSMFLQQLRDDLKRSGAAASMSNYTATQVNRRREVAAKLWKAYASYGKTFQDAAGQVQVSQPSKVQSSQNTSSGSRPPVTSSQMMRPPPPLRMITAPRMENVPKNNSVEVIELSDSDEEESNASKPKVLVPTAGDADFSARRGSTGQSYSYVRVLQLQTSGASEDTRRKRPNDATVTGDGSGAKRHHGAMNENAARSTALTVLTSPPDLNNLDLECIDITDGSPVKESEMAPIKRLSNGVYSVIGGERDKNANSNRIESRVTPDHVSVVGW